MKHIFWAIQTAIIYCLTLAAALLPASLAYRLGALAGLLIPHIVPKRRAVIIENINLSLPFMKSHHLWNSKCEDAGELARGTFKNLGRSLMEICRLYHGRGEDVIANIEIRGRENYEAARAKGKGLIFLSGHCGNWELMSLTLSSLFGREVSGVARRQDNPYLNRMVEQMRSRYNSRLIYKQGALKGILSALKKREMVGMLADQAVFPEEGYLVDVIGRKAWTSKAPVIIARKSGVPLIPVFIHREEERHVLTFYPEHLFSGDMSDEGIKKETQALSRYVENYVVAHPTQWYWVHRRWKRAGAAI
ncbi:lipid A biosynthesis acyltransferase [Geotalea daltonii FRC-32]|uniref:Lipid A biosynthesis acyltransferase n=1 Tax=Geotalea daltonii (strain DSM 22248 / JCM 15807 / FRC-32) TaxID=316067 RepID=B9LZG7_GEODF|nr:lysophospholipid acyltransferase family protein [Geotalea daltonii]ACM20720.1 lipid A biosynthesis acyltransferase [Geotalea daltonii FRC-32]